jgi:hypothetical protein
MAAPYGNDHLEPMKTANKNHVYYLSPVKS